MQSWKKYKFGELYDIRSGLSKARDQFGFGSPFVTFKNVFYNYFLPAELDELANTNEKEQNSGSVKKGDIFLTRTSETLHELGMSSVALKNYPNATFNGFCKRLRLKENLEIKVDPVFIGYYLRSTHFRREVTQHATMTTRASLNSDSINSLTVFLPTFIEQIQIGKILKPLDDKIEINLQMNKTLEEMAMALYKHWFVDFGPFQNGKFVESELGMIPEGWDVKSINSFGKIVCGKTPSKKDEKNFSSDQGYPFIKIPDMHGKVFVFETVEKISKQGNKLQLNKLLPAGSVNISCIATVGLVTINSLPAHTNQQINSIIPDNSSFKYYLYISMLNLKDRFMNEASGGSATLNMNTSTFSSIEILKPLNTELKEFDLLVSNLFEQINQNAIENQTLTTLRDTLLPKLISGEIRVKDVESMVAAL